MTRWPIGPAFAVVVLAYLLGVPAIAGAVPDPNACAPSTEGAQVTEIPSKVTYQCVCLTSVNTGIKRCHWVAITKGRGQAKISAEWAGSLGSLIYAETLQTDEPYFRSFGEVANFNGSQLSNAPPGWLASAQVVFHWNGSAWDKCRDSGFYYSSGTWATFGLTYNFGATPCGDGFYASNQYGFVWDGGRWQGDPAGVWSGYTTWSGCLVCAPVSPGPAPSTTPSLLKAPKGPPPRAPRGPSAGEISANGRHA